MFQTSQLWHENISTWLFFNVIGCLAPSRLRTIQYSQNNLMNNVHRGENRPVYNSLPYKCDHGIRLLL